MSLPIIAIVGRPNVGKSTLFNRIIGKRYAITSSVAGTTRDRVYHAAELGGYQTILVDTGGMDFGKKISIEADVQSQAKIAVEEADVILFVINATEPLTSSDLDCSTYLRKFKKSIILIAHKSDNKKTLEQLPELYELGFGEAIPVSSIHNDGIPELEEAIEKTLRKLGFKKKKEKKTKSIQIAIVGKPNVGKSSLVNAILGQDRLIVSDIPGTTIDATDTPFHFQDDDYTLIDTAGLRRRGKVRKGIEKYSVLRSLQAISRSDITCLVLDAKEGIARQDLHVSEYILEAGKGLIIVVNKSDLLEESQKDQIDFLNKLHHRMDYVPWAPAIFVSALKHKNIFKILDLGKHIAEERLKQIPPEQFNVFTETTVLAHRPARSGHKIIFTKGIQTKNNPPTFTFYVNNPDLIHFSYRRYMENEIRRKYGFYGTAIWLDFERS